MELVITQLKEQGQLTEEVLHGMFGDEIPEEIMEVLSETIS